MPESAAWYEETLYPLQNGVLRTLADCGAPFYLTGGTALHRHYFGRRFSDDLDLFVNRDPDFAEHVQRAVSSLRWAGYRLETASQGSEYFTSMLVRTEDADLKLDFVNDVAVRFGQLVPGALYPRIDSLRNLLSNKVTCLSRLEAKDFADLWILCRRLPFHWSEILDEAREKDLGVTAEMTTGLLRSFPERLFGSVRWRRPPDPEAFFADLRRIATDLIRARPNSLCA